mmetsp:Transcript_1813/g.3224  ORF Transcript_1813/g.3224 Transcript_1813/m.3224 type:complete len:268 (-) Transcript_1813:164-967(-)
MGTIQTAKSSYLRISNPTFGCVTKTEYLGVSKPGGNRLDISFGFICNFASRFAAFSKSMIVNGLFLFFASSSSSSSVDDEDLARLRRRMARERFLLFFAASASSLSSSAVGVDILSTRCKDARRARFEIRPMNRNLVHQGNCFLTNDDACSTFCSMSTTVSRSLKSSSTAFPPFLRRVDSISSNKSERLCLLPLSPASSISMRRSVGDLDVMARGLERDKEFGLERDKEFRYESVEDTPACRDIPERPWIRSIAAVLILEGENPWPC